MKVCLLVYLSTSPTRTWIHFGKLRTESLDLIPFRSLAVCRVRFIDCGEIWSRHTLGAPLPE